MIRFEKVSFSWESQSVLRDVSFTISPNTFVGIIGPNGGGKTTLLKLMMGFLTPQRGKIEIFSLPPKKARPYIGWVPQSFQFDRSFPISVLEMILGGRIGRAPLFGGYQKEDVEAAKEALTRVRLQDKVNAPFSTLSGGQMQRALIARAICSQPKLLILDEPASGIDPQSEEEMYSLLDSFRSEMTLVMVTHDLKAAIDRVDRVFCVQGGVVAISADQVCEHFALGLYHTPLKIAKEEDKK